MTLRVTWTTQFKRDVKTLKKRGYDLDLLYDAVDLLRRQEELPPRMKDHGLKGTWIGFRECHIRDDWVLVYATDGERMVLALTRTGTHSDVFGE